MDEEADPDRWRRGALWFGGLPLGVGCLTFGLWMLLRLEGLMAIGVLTLVGGTGCFLGGTLSLARYVILSRREPARAHPRWRVRAAFAGVLLAVNWPAAGAIVVAAQAVHSTYRVEIRNGLEAPVTDIRLLLGGTHTSLGDLAPGARRTISFRDWGEGGLDIRAAVNGAPVSGTVDAYVIQGQGGDRIVTVRPGPRLEIVDRRRPDLPIGP